MIRGIFIIPRLFRQLGDERLITFPPDQPDDPRTRLINGGHRRSVTITLATLLVGTLLAVVIGFALFASGVFLSAEYAAMSSPFGGLFVLPAAMTTITASLVAFPIACICVPLYAAVVGFFLNDHAVNRAKRQYEITIHRHDEMLGEDLTLLMGRAGYEYRPEIGVITSPRILNAFAIGSGKLVSLITISQPLIDILTPDERRAVLAHELGHVINRDMARMGFALSVQESLTWFLIFRRVKLVVRWLFTLVSEIAIQSLSREREYWADAMGAALTSPEAMIGALRKLEAYSDYVPEERRQARLMIRASASGLFATHPPVHRRIEALEAQTYLRRLNLTLPSEVPAPLPGASEIPGLVSDAADLAEEPVVAPGRRPAGTAPRQEGWLDALVRFVWATGRRLVALVALIISAVAHPATTTRNGAAVLHRVFLASPTRRRWSGTGVVVAALAGGWLWLSTYPDVAPGIADLLSGERRRQLSLNERSVQERAASLTRQENAVRDKERLQTLAISALESRERENRDYGTRLDNRAAVLARQETSLQQKDRELQARMTGLDQRESTLSRQENDLRERKRAFENVETGRNALDRDLRTRSARLDELQASLTRWDAEVKSVQQRQSQQQAALDLRGQSLDRRDRDLTERERLARRPDNSPAQPVTGPSEQDGRLKAREDAVTEREKRVSVREAAADATKATLDKLAADLKSRTAVQDAGSGIPSQPAVDMKTLLDREEKVRLTEIAQASRSAQLDERAARLDALAAELNARQAVTPPSGSSQGTKGLFLSVFKTVTGEFFAGRGNTVAEAVRTAQGGCQGRYSRPCVLQETVQLDGPTCFAVLANSLGESYGTGRTLTEAGEQAEQACSQKYGHGCRVDRSRNLCVP